MFSLLEMYGKLRVTTFKVEKKRREVVMTVKYILKI